MSGEEREARAYALFAAWSSGDLDAPRAHLTDDAVLWDAVGGEHAGWPAIRAYFARGIARYPDLRLAPTGEFWHRDDGIALTWTMSATVRGDEYGPAARGRVWRVDGMSYLVFRGDRVAREADYHDAGARRRSVDGGQAVDTP
jgi:ketosteroid isomerase-like protein